VDRSLWREYYGLGHVDPTVWTKHGWLQHNAEQLQQTGGKYP